MGAKLTVPKKAHPLVRRLFQMMIQQRTTLIEVAHRSGVDRKTIGSWRASGHPNIVNLEAALGVFGYELRAVSVDTIAQPSLEDRLRAAGVEIAWVKPSPPPDDTPSD